MNRVYGCLKAGTRNQNEVRKMAAMRDHMSGDYFPTGYLTSEKVYFFADTLIHNQLDTLYKKKIQKSINLTILYLVKSNKNIAEINGKKVHFFVTSAAGSPKSGAEGPSEIPVETAARMG